MARSSEGEPRIGENVRAARRARGSAWKPRRSDRPVQGMAEQIENGNARLERRQDIAALAEALSVSADGLLGEPAPGICLDGQMYNITPLQRTLLDTSPDDPPDIPARPLDVLREEVAQADTALRAADHATVIQLLSGAIAELCVHAGSGDGPDRCSALRLLVCAYGSDATCVLRQIGETNLAWIAGERARQAAELLDDPVWKAAAAYGRAHSRSSANKPRALLITPQIPDEVEPHIGDDRFAHEAYGMLRLSAALACAVQNDHHGAAEQAAEAARLAARAGERPQAWELFGPANVGVWRTSLAIEAGEAEDALTYAGQVEPRDLASHNRRAACGWRRPAPTRCSATIPRRCRRCARPSGCHPPRPATTPSSAT